VAAEQPDFKGEEGRERTVDVKTDVKYSNCVPLGVLGASGGIGFVRAVLRRDPHEPNRLNCEKQARDRAPADMDRTCHIKG